MKRRPRYLKLWYPPYKTNDGSNTIPGLGFVHLNAKALLELRQFRQATSMVLRAVNGYEQTLGPNHIKTLECLLVLARIKREQRDFPAAEAILNQAMSRLGDPNTLTESERVYVTYCERDLAMLLFLEGQTSRALTLMQSVAANFEQLWGESDARTIEVRRILSQREAWSQFERSLTEYSNGDSEIIPSFVISLDPRIGATVSFQKNINGKVVTRKRKRKLSMSIKG